MNWFSPKTLRGWFTLIALAALTVSQSASLLLLAAQETILRTRLHEEEAFRRIDGLIKLSKFADARTRRIVETTTSSPSFQVQFAAKPILETKPENVGLSELLAARAQLPTNSVRVAWSSVPSQRIYFRRVENTERSIVITHSSSEVSRHSDLIGAMFPEAQVPPVPPVPPMPPEPPAPPKSPRVITHFDIGGSSIDGAMQQKSPEPLDVSVRMPDGQWLNVRAIPAQSPSAFGPLVLAGGLTALLVAAATYWAAGRVARPLAGLTAAAEKFGQNGALMLAPVEGPSDVAKAGRAFNMMAQRLTRTLEDQRALLNAVGHDLRTPIATLRVRIEHVSDGDLQNRMLSTLTEMERLTDATLTAARGGESGEVSSLIDLPSLVEAVCDDLNDARMPVHCSELPPAVVHGRLGEIRRALRNLIENAVRYGGVAEVSLSVSSTWASIHIDDQGDGIPDASMSEVVKPFVRLETSRNADTGGHGLGLTITRAIAERHNGNLKLSNRPEGGLRATLMLPLS